MDEGLLVYILDFQRIILMLQISKSNNFMFKSKIASSEVANFS